MLKELRKLAASLDARWKAAGYDIHDFPDLAATALGEIEADRVYDRDEFGEWILTAKSFPPVCNPFGPLGPPAFTVWSNGRFFVNVYAYHSPEVVIHDHNFAGAFVNAVGRTAQCVFRFDATERVDPTLHVGTLDLTHVEIIREGDIRRIEPGSGFIHQVWHLSRPTVVLVIRTPSMPRRSLRQFEYFQPFLAAEIFRDEKRDAAIQRFLYTRKMLQLLRASGHSVEYLLRVIERERPWAAVWHMVENWQLLREAGALEEGIARGVRRQGQWFTSMERVAARGGLFYSIDWRHVVDEQDRLVLALLVTMSSWTEIANALARFVPAARPADVVVASLARLHAARAVPLTLTGERQAMLRCLLESDGDRNQWRRLVRELFDVNGRRDWSEARRIVRELESNELLRPLVTPV